MHGSYSELFIYLTRQCFRVTFVISLNSNTLNTYHAHYQSCIPHPVSCTLKSICQFTHLDISDSLNFLSDFLYLEVVITDLHSYDPGLVYFHQ